MAMLVTLHVWRWGRSQMGAHGTTGKPRRGDWGRSRSCAFHPQMPSLPPHMVPRRSVRVSPPGSSLRQNWERSGEAVKVGSLPQPLKWVRISAFGGLGWLTDGGGAERASLCVQMKPSPAHWRVSLRLTVCLCTPVTEQGPCLLEGSVLLSTYTQGHVHSHCPLPEALDQPRGEAVSNVHRDVLCAPDAHL